MKSKNQTNSSLKEIERQLRLKNAELNIEVEKYKSAQSVLEETCVVLTLVSEISKDIVEKGEIIDIDEVLKKIGTKLQLKKIFLYRFSNIIEPYKEWVHDIGCQLKITLKENEDLTQLMNWVYEKKCYSDFANSLPSFFNILKCPKKEIFCSQCNLIMIPVVIENKPWGIMGFAKITEENCNELTRRAIMNLSNLVSLLIKNQEENQSLIKMIDDRLKTFKLTMEGLKGSNI